MVHFWFWKLSLIPKMNRVNLVTAHGVLHVTTLSWVDCADFLVKKKKKVIMSRSRWRSVIVKWTSFARQSQQGDRRFSNILICCVWHYEAGDTGPMLARIEPPGMTRENEREGKKRRENLDFQGIVALITRMHTDGKISAQLSDEGISLSRVRATWYAYTIRPTLIF